MNTKRGKGYFYAMGQRDRYNFDAGEIRASLIRQANRKDWPKWAKYAYILGINGWAL